MSHAPQLEVPLMRAFTLAVPSTYIPSRVHVFAWHLPTITFLPELVTNSLGHPDIHVYLYEIFCVLT
jgi:hypothetical protein